MAPPDPVRLTRSPTAVELAATLALAWPLVLTNLAQMGLATVDVVLIGRLGPDALAASALATNLYFAFGFFGVGLASATAPLMAEALGRKLRVVRDVRRTVRQGLWLAVGTSAPISVVLWQGEALLVFLGQEPRLAAVAGSYLRALEGGLLPFIGFSVLRFFIGALERPGAGLVIGLATIPFNAGLAWLLIWGGAGVPALGLEGAGIATTITSWLCFGALALHVARARRFRRWRVFGRWWRPDGPRLRRLLGLGLPISATLLFETGVFNAAALVMGLFGPVVLAAHAIALQVAALSFMVPLGIAQAATVRVGLAYGARDPAAVTRAGRVAIGLAIAAMGTTAIGLLLAPRAVLSAFIDPDGADASAVRTTASAFLLVAAAFQVADGLQAVGSGLLRGIQDTRVPMMLAGLGYWGIGATLGLLLAFPAGLQGRGIWIGLAVGLFATAGLLLARWMARDVGRDRRPA